MTFQAQNHSIQPCFTRAESDAVHECPNEVVRDRERSRWRLTVHSRENYRQDGGDRRRLPDVEVGVEIHLPIDHLGNDVDTGLALGHVELATVEIPESLRQRLELLRVGNERLHLFLASHRAELAKHAVDGGRNRRVSHRPGTNVASRREAEGNSQYRRGRRMPTRRSSARWEGGLKGGKGTFQGE